MVKREEGKNRDKGWCANDNRKRGKKANGTGVEWWVCVGRVERDGAQWCGIVKGKRVKWKRGGAQNG